MKKRIASLLAALALCLTLLPMAAFAEDAAPDAWDGTADTSWYVGHESDTEYHITTAEQLAGLAEVINKENAPVSFEGKTVYLDNDLDLAGHEWISIGNGLAQQNATQYDPDWYYSFNGTFDGQGHVIYNLYSHDSLFNKERDCYMSGLFGQVFHGKVMNLGVADADIWVDPNDTSTFGKGILVDYLAGSVIENCWTSGSITGGSYFEKYIGGLVGCTVYGSRDPITTSSRISGCYSTATITGNYGSSSNAYPPAFQMRIFDSLGGIIGGPIYGHVDIDNCWFDGKIVVNSIQANVGGIIGYTDDANIENCMVLTTDIGADPTSDDNTYWIGYLTDPATCMVVNNLWPSGGNNYDPSPLKYVSNGSITADSQGRAVSDFTSSDILTSLQQNAANGVQWVAGISHPTFAWDSRNIPADYTAVDNAVAAAQKVDAGLYANYDAVQAALDAVDRTKSKAHQAEVDAMAKAIEDAIAALTYKPADYTAVDAAIAKAGALNRDDYTDFSAVDAAINAVDRSKNITQQADVDAMAKAIEGALAALVVKPTATPAPTEAPTPAPAAPAATAEPKPTATAAPTATPAPVVTATPQPPVTIPQTGDSMNVTLLFALTLCSGAALGLAAHKKNRS
mgnify:CR=1 FL=1